MIVVTKRDAIRVMGLRALRGNGIKFNLRKIWRKGLYSISIYKNGSLCLRYHITEEEAFTFYKYKKGDLVSNVDPSRLIYSYYDGIIYILHKFEESPKKTRKDRIRPYSQKVLNNINSDIYYQRHSMYD